MTRPFSHAGHYNLAMASVFLGMLRNQDILINTAIIRHHNAQVMFNEIAPHNITLLRLYDSHNARFAAAFGVFRGFLHQHDIAVQDTIHLMMRDK